MQLVDSLETFLKIFNADGRYHVILSNNAKDNVLMSSEQYDITSEFIIGMNARYKKLSIKRETKIESCEINLSTILAIFNSGCHCAIGECTDCVSMVSIVHDGTISKV